MGRMYSISFEEVAVTAAQDLFEVVAAADSVVLLHALYLSQSSEEADAQAEMLPLLIHRGSTSGSGGSTPTPAPMNLGDAAFGGTAEANNTTQSTEGTFIHADSWNVQIPYQLIWTPEMRPVISPSGRIIVELQAAPADSVTMNGTLYVEELGG